MANFDVQFRSFEIIWKHYKNATVNEKKAILDDSFTGKSDSNCRPYKI